MNALAEPEIMPDGSGRWVIHLDNGGTALCGKEAVLMRTGDVLAATCERCLSVVKSVANVSSEGIDFVMGVYGWANDITAQVVECLSSLQATCDLTGVVVSCVERVCQPVPGFLRDVIGRAGFVLRACPLPPFSNCLEDTSQFCNWMMDNVGDHPWVIISHFDMVFKGDYVRHVRSLMPAADMVGNHHDGVVAVKRDSYRRCGVGFHGIDGASMCVVNDANLPRIIPDDTPKRVAPDRKHMIALDVGELLALRMRTLGLRHVWMQGGRTGTDVGKSALFTHARMGSGHS